MKLTCFWQVFTRFGLCYIFNSGVSNDDKPVPVLSTTKGGVDNGLELLLDTQQNEYMPVWNETGILRNCLFIFLLLPYYSAYNPIKLLQK